MLIEQAQANMRHAYLWRRDGRHDVGAGVAGGRAHRVPGELHAAPWPRCSSAACSFIRPPSCCRRRSGGRALRPGDNPLKWLALESTVWLLLAIAVAFIASLQKTEWFFIAMLLTIGGRYLTFATLYGLRIYWACGATLAAAGIALAMLGAGTGTIALTGGLIELVFAANRLPQFQACPRLLGNEECPHLSAADVGHLGRQDGHELHVRFGR